MNCSQIDNLLPLYAGQDLDDRRERVIAAHLESCETCTSAFAEYCKTRNLLHDFAAPEVADEVYAQLRRAVWQRIETESSQPSLLVTLRGWFQPRLVLAIAAAVLLIVCAVGLYSLANRLAVGPQRVAYHPEVLVHPSIGPIEAPDSSSSNSSAGTSPPRRADEQKRKRKPDQVRAPDRADVAYSPDAQILKSESSWQTPRTEDADSDKTMRVEIQTRNPNIRIIWFTQQGAKPAAAHSKGT
jgi:anti-sigma factor RsiW